MDELKVLILTEINQTNKGQTFCDSTSMRYPNESNPKPEKAKSDPQELKRIHVSWTPLSIPWGKWLPMTSPKPNIQIIRSHIQSNECRHKFTIYTNSLKFLNRQKAKLYLWCLSFAISFAYRYFVSVVPQFCLWNLTTTKNTKVYPKKDIKHITWTLKS